MLNTWFAGISKPARNSHQLRSILIMIGLLPLAVEGACAEITGRILRIRRMFPLGALGNVRFARRVVFLVRVVLRVTLEFHSAMAAVVTGSAYYPVHHVALKPLDGDLPVAEREPSIRC